MKKAMLILAVTGVLGSGFASAEGGRSDRHAVKQIDQAIQLMNRALPIYNGKRAEADDLCRLARREVFEATHPNARDTDRYRKLQDADDRGRYSRRQVEDSQRNMREALRKVESALGDLKRSDGTYDETNEAVRDLRKAAALTRRCLDDRGR